MLVNDRKIAALPCPFGATTHKATLGARLELPNFGRLLIEASAEVSAARTTESGTFSTFACDIPSGSSRQKATFNVDLGLSKRCR